MSFSPKAIIYLEHKIRAFTPSSRQLASFKKALYAYDLLLLESLQELEAEIPSCQLLLTWSFPVRLYEKAKVLKYIFTPAAGREWVFQDPRGKVKVYYGDFHGQLISQEIIGMIFYFANNFHQALEAQEKDPDTKVIFVTKDVNLRIRAAALGLIVTDYDSEGQDIDELYTGIGEIDMSGEDIDQFYKDGEIPFKEEGYYANQFALMRDRSNPTHTALGKMNTEEQVIRPVNLPKDLRSCKKRLTRSIKQLRPTEA